MSYIDYINQYIVILKYPDGHIQNPHNQEMHNENLNTAHQIECERTSWMLHLTIRAAFQLIDPGLSRNRDLVIPHEQVHVGCIAISFWKQVFSIGIMFLDPSLVLRIEEHDATVLDLLGGNDRRKGRQQCHGRSEYTRHVSRG